MSMSDELKEKCVFRYCCRLLGTNYSFYILWKTIKKNLPFESFPSVISSVTHVGKSNDSFSVSCVATYTTDPGPLKNQNWNFKTYNIL